MHRSVCLFALASLVPMLSWGQISIVRGGGSVIVNGGSSSGSGTIVNGRAYKACNGNLSINGESATCDGRPLEPMDGSAGRPAPEVNPCQPLRATKHPLGGGYVSENAKVGSGVTVPASTSICGSIAIPRNVVIGANAKISGNDIEIGEDVRIGANVEINGTGKIGKATNIGANTNLNGNFDLENTQIRANSELRGRVTVRGVNVEGRMENCNFSGKATGPAAAGTR